MRTVGITAETLEELGERLEDASGDVRRHRRDLAQLARALTVRCQLLEALADLARTAGPGARAVRIAASLASEADGDAAAKASAQLRRRGGNPVDGLGAAARQRSGYSCLSSASDFHVGAELVQEALGLVFEFVAGGLPPTVGFAPYGSSYDNRDSGNDHIGFDQPFANLGADLHAFVASLDSVFGDGGNPLVKLTSGGAADDAGGAGPGRADPSQVGESGQRLAEHGGDGLVLELFGVPLRADSCAV